MDSMMNAYESEFFYALVKVQLNPIPDLACFGT
jgi:hypothetical protein